MKATKVWKALEKLENLGEVVCDNLLKTIKAQSGNVMDNFQWVSTDVGAKLTGVDPFAFFDSFQKSFPTVLVIPINKLAPYEIAGFTIGNEYGTRVSIKYGGNTNPNGYTLEIKLPSGRITKIRFE